MSCLHNNPPLTVELNADFHKLKNNSKYVDKKKNNKYKPISNIDLCL